MPPSDTKPYTPSSYRIHLLAEIKGNELAIGLITIALVARLAMKQNQSAIKFSYVQKTEV